MTPDQIFNEYLHGTRASMLARLPKPRTMLSAGCNGTPFFKWIERNMGYTGPHIGVEFYCPKPHDLPPNVRWIANTVGHMPDVEDASCDLLFSGQNLEHLWADELCGFLAEAHRILEVGGRLVVDSPNRLVTADQCWTHPEHTLELTVDEAEELLKLSGFDIDKCEGIWLSREMDNSPIPLMPSATADGSMEANSAERIVKGLHNPDRSFIWWIEAIRSSRKPDVEGIAVRLAEIYKNAWAERMSRFSRQIGLIQEDGSGRFVTTSKGEAGFVLYGPYLPLRAGKYEASLEIDVSGSGVPAIADIRTVKGEIANTEVRKSGVVKFPFKLDETTFGFEFRVQATGSGSVRARHKLTLVNI